MPKKEVKVKEKKDKQKKHFLKDVRAELKKVIWPNSKQLVNNTVAVIAVVLIVGAIVFVLDFCFEKINSFGVDKLKSAVQTNNVETTDDSAVATEDVTAENTEEVKTETTEQPTEEVSE